MYSKALLRSAIDNKKSEYFDNDVSYALVEASIYKGLYLAIGGKKDIPIPPKFNDIVIISEVFIKAFLKSEDTKYIKKKLEEYNKYVDINCDEELTIENYTNLFVDTVFTYYNEDIIINRVNLKETMEDLIRNKLKNFEK